MNDKGQVKNTMQNVYQVFQSDPVLHGAIGYNILTGRIDICKPLWWERTASAMSDSSIISEVRHQVTKCTGTEVRAVNVYVDSMMIG